MPNLEARPNTEQLPLDELGRIGFSLAMQMLASREDAADAVQDSIHQLLRKYAAFDPQRGKLQAWFLKIVRNRCLDQIRRTKRNGTSSSDVAALPANRQPSPDTIVEQREQLALLKAELMTMPDDQREMILLRDFHRLSYAEIADVMSIPQGTMMSRLHRARAELRRRMDNHR